MDIRRHVLAGGCKLLHWSGVGTLLAQWTQGAGLIFTLHRVGPPATGQSFRPNDHLHVTPEFLDATIRQVRAAGLEIVSLSEALDRLDRRDPDARRFAAFTFDDGYRDNLIHAYPVLKRHDVPFTIFVASGFIDRTSEIWWEAIERIVCEETEIALPIGSTMTTLPARTHREKRRVFIHLLHWFTRELGEASQRLEMRRLAERHGLDLAALADDLMLSWDELRELRRDPLFTVGAHTHDHFALARMTDAGMREDIARGLERLEAELGVRPEIFAYPYGYEAAVNSHSAEVVAEFGFRAAVTTSPGMLHGQDARLALPRVSLNGYFQNRDIVAQYLTGAPFPLYNAAHWLRERLTPQWSSA